MAKKKKQNNKSILKLVALILGAGALLLALLNCVNYVIKGSTEVVASLTGFETMFGKTEGDLVKVTLTSFSILSTLAFVLPLAGGILTLPKNKILNFVAVMCFVAAAALIFLLPSLVVTKVYVAEVFTGSLAIGAILSAICSILGGLISIYVTFTK